ncbi:hypothetical protein OROGR_017795 [Orobanche gracilis]
MAQMNVLGGLLFSLWLLVPLTSAKPTDVHYCNKKADYAVKVSGLDIDPYPISTGKNTTFKISASTSTVETWIGNTVNTETFGDDVQMRANNEPYEAISGGKLKIGVSYFGFHIHSEDHDLCQETSCPVSVGDFNVTHTQELPGYTPWGSYTLEMTMVDANDKRLTCITFGFSIGFVAEENLADI